MTVKDVLFLFVLPMIVSMVISMGVTYLIFKK